MKVVLDTNVWVSAYLSPKGAPGRVVKAVSSGRIEAVSTEHLWTELRRVLYEPKVREIVTGDKALLGLARIGNVLIVSPGDFVNKVLETAK